MAERRHVRIDPADNVTTVVDGEVALTVLAGGFPVVPGIPFGHKVALVPIAEGAAIVKYGVAIGYTTQDIPAGAHVHVHNCR